MNILIKFSLLCFLTSSFSYSQIPVPNDFEKIPDSLHFKDGLYQYLIPNQNYDYWRVIRKDSSTSELIYENIISGNLKYLQDHSPENGFFWECLPDGCFSYILAYKDQKAEYFTNENELRKFLAYIDNLQEALLLAKTYGFWFDTKEKIGGSYKMDKNNIYMYLAKFSSCLVSSESFIVKVNRKTQEFEYKSNGKYYESDKCYSD